MTQQSDWFPERSGWAQAGGLFAAFGGAMALGYALGELLAPGSDAAAAIGAAAFLGAFFLGYTIWVGYIASLVSASAFGGLLRAIRRFVFSRDRKDLETAGKHLKEAMASEEHFKRLAAKARAKAGVFRWLGAVFGALAGTLVGLFVSESGFLIAAPAYAVAGLSYGSAVTWLVREGYMALPEDMEI